MLVAVVTALHLLICLALIGLILLHRGRGGGISDMFGGGVSGAVQGSAVALADSINSTFELLNGLRTNMNEFISSTVDEVNRIAEEISELNRQINSLEAGASTANASS